MSLGLCWVSSHPKSWAIGVDSGLEEAACACQFFGLAQLLRSSRQSLSHARERWRGLFFGGPWPRFQKNLTAQAGMAGLLSSRIAWPGTKPNVTNLNSRQPWWQVCPILPDRPRVPQRSQSWGTAQVHTTLLSGLSQCSLHQSTLEDDLIGHVAHTCNSYTLGG